LRPGNAGLIRHLGMSNFDVDDLDELLRLPGGNGVETDQILDNLMRRGPPSGPRPLEVLRIGGEDRGAPRRSPARWPGP
jgi:hypothetical protein